MASATIYNTSKRHNSTSVPSGGTPIDVQLKGGCDLNKPVFLLYYDDSLGLPSMSEIGFGGRYYFVDSIRSIRDNLYEVSCSVDALATYKTEILATSAFVKYYSHNNTEIVDTRLSTKTTKSLTVNQGMFTTLGAISGTDGTIVLMVNGLNTVGAYALSISDVPNILAAVDVSYLDAITTNIDFTRLEDSSLILDLLDWFLTLGDILDQWFRSVIGKIIYSGDALSNIRSAHILPLSLNNVSLNTGQHIYLGSFDTEVNGRLITDRIFTDSASVAIPWQASDWRRNSPYHELFLYIPYIGVVQLSPSDLIGDASLTVSVCIDKLSGDAIFEVTSSSGQKIGQYSTNVASQYPLGSSNVSMAKGMGGIITSAAGLGVAVATIATGGTAAPILAGASAAGVGLVNAISPTPTSIGGLSGAAPWGLSDRQYIKCISVFHDTVVAPSNPSAVFGTPYNAVLALSGVSGYVQTVGASVSGNMTDWERNEINRLLDGGVYIE